MLARYPRASQRVADVHVFSSLRDAISKSQSVCVIKPALYSPTMKCLSNSRASSGNSGTEGLMPDAPRRTRSRGFALTAQPGIEGRDVDIHAPADPDDATIESVGGRFEDPPPDGSLADCAFRRFGDLPRASEIFEIHHTASC